MNTARSARMLLQNFITRIDKATVHITCTCLFALMLIACESTPFESSSLSSAEENKQPENSACDDMSSDSSVYTLSFQSNWNSTTFPLNYPSSAHFTTLIGATHNATVTIWAAGEQASAGVENMAELGRTSTLKAEINAINQDAIGELVEGSPSTDIEFTVTTATPLLSIATMVAPTSDWFTGVSQLNFLNEDGNWRDDFSLNLVVYDAGTEDDTTVFSLGNSEASPHLPISKAEHPQSDIHEGKHRTDNSYIASFSFSKMCSESS